MSTPKDGEYWAKKNRALLFLLLLTAFSSVGHYVHKIIHFEHYPEPEWLNPQIIDAFWLVMTPFAAMGLYFDKKQTPKRACASFTTYALLNMLTLLHYACEIKMPMTFAIHFFIWFEAICAMLLLLYVWRRHSRTII